MIDRRLYSLITDRLAQFPAVALLGPRQVGKTTLATSLARDRKSIYLDLEAPHDHEKLADPVRYLSLHQDKLVILDEVQRMPGLFLTLRGLIDEGREKGIKAGRFLLLGSASIDLLRQSGESLAGRIAYLELNPIDILETPPEQANLLWLRGGFPDSLLATDHKQSLIWRKNFIRPYLERDTPQLGPRIPAETLRRFWTMLAHNQGQLFNASQLAQSLAVDGKTVSSYLDLLVDLLLVRRLSPYFINIGKRLVKSPKVYIRDSGLLHALLRIDDQDALFGHPVIGPSWEGFAIENIVNSAPARTIPSFYRTATGVEIDLLLELPGGELWAIEIKHSLSPKLEKGFYTAKADIKPVRSFVVYPGAEPYPIAADIEAIPLPALCELLASRT